MPSGITQAEVVNY